MKKLFLFVVCSLLSVSSLLGQGTVNQGAPADASDAWPVTGPVTDSQIRATPVPVSGTVTTAFTPSTSTGTLDGLNDEVILALGGAQGAGVVFSPGLTATIRFFESHDNGTTYNEAGAYSVFTQDVSNRLTTGLVNPDANSAQWVFQIGGGATHAKVRVTAFTGGSATATLYGTNVPTGTLQYAGPSGSRPLSGVQLVGPSGSQTAAVALIETSNVETIPGSAAGMVVRNVTATQFEGSSILSLRANIVGGQDAANLVRNFRLLDATPVGTEFGVVTRNIPSGTQPVSGPLTDAQLRAMAVPVSGSLTDTELRATAVPISGTVTATGPLTDTQLRATAVPVSGPLTDTQLRAAAVPISGTVTATGPLTDIQLRATPVPVSGTVTVAATDLDIRNFVFATDKVDVSGSTGVGVTGAFFQATQPISAVSLPLPTGAATEATQLLGLTTTAFNASASASQASLTAGTLAATTTAAALAGSTAIVQVTFQNDPDNTVDMLCGNSTTQPIQLFPGGSGTWNVTNINIVFCKTVSGTGTVNWVAR